MSFDLAQAYIMIRADGSMMVHDFNKAKPAAVRSSKKLGTTMGQVMSRAFGAAGALGVALAYMKIASMGEQFNRKMRNSLAIMGDVSSALRGDMANAAMEAANVTQFSTAETAKSYFYLASAGLSAAQSVKAMPAVAQFAQAGLFDLSEATTLAADAQAALGMKSKDPQKNMGNMVRITDVLTKANTLANASVRQFSQSLTTKAGAAAKVAGMPLEEVVALLAAMADQGIKAHDAGTAVNIVLRDLKTKAVENAAAFKELNVAVYNSDGSLRNIADIIGDIEKAMEGASAREKNLILSHLGFIDKSKIFIQSIIGTSEKIRDFEKALYDAGGTTREVADKQLTPLQKSMAKIGVAFTQVGQVLMRIVEPMATVLGDNIQMMIKLMVALRAATMAYKLVGLAIKYAKFEQIAFMAVEAATTVYASIASGNILLMRKALLQVGAAIAVGTTAYLAMNKAFGEGNTQIKKAGEAFEEGSTQIEKAGSAVNMLTGEYEDLNKQMKRNIELSKEKASLDKNFRAYLFGPRPDTTPRGLVSPKVLPEEIKESMRRGRGRRREAFSDDRSRLPGRGGFIPKGETGPVGRLPWELDPKTMEAAYKDLKGVMEDMKTPTQTFLELQQKLNGIIQRNPGLVQNVIKVWNQARSELTGYKDMMQGMSHEYIKMSTGMGDYEFEARRLIGTWGHLLSVGEKWRLLQRAIAQDAFLEKREEEDEAEREAEQKKKQAESEAEALASRKEQFANTLKSERDLVMEDFEKIKYLLREGMISPEMAQRGVQGLAERMKSQGPQTTEISGRMGYAAFANSIQDAILKDDTPKMTLAEARKHTTTLGNLETLNTRMLEALNNRGGLREE